jgi:hypothetical protein
MLRFPVRAALLLTLALGTVSCGDDEPLPTGPAPIPSIEESFSGTLGPSTGAVARTHVFQVQNAGDVIAQLTALDPDTTVVGLSIGTTNGFACQAAVSTEQAKINNGLVGVARSAGSLCVRIYNPSDDPPFPDTVTYTIKVTHY